MITARSPFSTGWEYPSCHASWSRCARTEQIPRLGDCLLLTLAGFLFANASFGALFWQNESARRPCMDYKTLGSLLRVTWIKYVFEGETHGKGGRKCTKILMFAPFVHLKRLKLSSLFGPGSKPMAICPLMIPFNIYNKGFHGQINGIFAMYFHNLSLLFVLSTKQGTFMANNSKWLWLGRICI